MAGGRASAAVALVKSVVDALASRLYVHTVLIPPSAKRIYHYVDSDVPVL